MDIKKFVQEFMKPRDFVPGVYKNGPHSFRAEPVLEDLLEEWEQSRQAAVSDSLPQSIIQATIQECKSELLNHLFPVIHSNGYPIKAVPQATILELPALMKKLHVCQQCNAVTQQPDSECYKYPSGNAE